MHTKLDPKTGDIRLKIRSNMAPTHEESHSQRQKNKQRISRMSHPIHAQYTVFPRNASERFERAKPPHETQVPNGPYFRVHRGTKNEECKALRATKSLTTKRANAQSELKEEKVSITTTQANTEFQIEYFLVIIIIWSRESDGF